MWNAIVKVFKFWIFLIMCVGPTAVLMAVDQNATLTPGLYIIGQAIAVTVSAVLVLWLVEEYC